MNKEQLIRKVRETNKNLRNLKEICGDAFEIIEGIDSETYSLDGTVDNYEEAVDESKQAMESVLDKIAGEFGVKSGDVFGLAEEIVEYKKMTKRFATKLIISLTYTQDDVLWCDNCGVSGGEHEDWCEIATAQRYLEGLEDEYVRRKNDEYPTYRNNKTGDVYSVLDTGIINATNDVADQNMKMVIYRKGDLLFCRSEEEFYEKFTAVEA